MNRCASQAAYVASISLCAQRRCSGLAAGVAIGVAGDAGVRAVAQQPKVSSRSSHATMLQHCFGCIAELFCSTNAQHVLNCMQLIACRHRGESRAVARTHARFVRHKSSTATITCTLVFGEWHALHLLSESRRFQCRPRATAHLPRPILVFCADVHRHGADSHLRRGAYFCHARPCLWG